jgi:hypothetical protein
MSNDRARIIGGIALDEEQMLEWHLYVEAACDDEALADAVWRLAHEPRGGRWMPVGRLPSMALDADPPHVSASSAGR